MLERIIVNDIDITPFKSHPRILELRFIETYDMWEREFGDRTDGILLGLASAFHCDITKLRAVANQSPAIRKITKGNRQKHIREIIFMGEVWRETRWSVAKRYLRLSQRSLYADPSYLPKGFVTQEWLAELDQEIVACGLKQYAIEVERFLDSLDVLRKVI